MALRNISNIPHHPQNYEHYYTSGVDMPVLIQPHVHHMMKPHIAKHKILSENKPQATASCKNLVPQHPKRITNSVSSSSANTVSTTASSSSTNSTTSASSIQIRTSSPISSSDSEQSGPANHVISPSKFMNAVHQSRAASIKPNVNNYQQMHQQQQQQQHIIIPTMTNYASMKQLAYEKLRKQQAVANPQFLNQVMDQQAKLKSMGKLKVATYNNLTHLTVHVVQGRSYKLVEPNEATYVKVNILPDEELSFTNIKTKSIKPSVLQSRGQSKQQYIYDSKFSFEIDQLNQGNNRLLLSVWSAKLDKLIGCFSFKIKHLLQQNQQQNQMMQMFTQKPKQTWYHLLPIKYGVSKHLKCQVIKKTSSSVSSNGSSRRKNQRGLQQVEQVDAPLTNVNKDLIGMTKLQLLLEKNENDSYGFTITSSCPCMIGKVDLDKAAFRYGLRPGDFISKINGNNVSRATVESVVKAVKSSKVKLYIEVYRQDSNLIENIYRSKPKNAQQVHRMNTQPIYQQIRPESVQQQQPADLRHVSSKPCFGLEVVPEEDEIDEEEDDSQESQDEYDDFDDEYEDEEVEQQLAANDDEAAKEELNFFKLHDSIRFVDSLSTSEILVQEEGDVKEVEQNVQTEENAEAEEMRRVAAQIYLANNSLNSSNTACKHASIRYLTSNKSISHLSGKFAQKITLSDFNQFI
jgi:hypothetical protein